MSHIKVKITDTQIIHKSGVSKAGKKYAFDQQENIFVEKDGEIRRVPIALNEEQKPFSPGVYTIDESKIYRIGSFGFEISRQWPTYLVLAQSAAIPKAA